MSQQYKVGRTATSIHTNDGITVIRYHQTAVVQFTPTKVILDAGGYRTATTKTRMNQASNQFGLGFQVFQKNHVWFVDTPQGKTIEFQDGMNFSR